MTIKELQAHTNEKIDDIKTNFVEFKQEIKEDFKYLSDNATNKFDKLEAMVKNGFDSISDNQNIMLTKITEHETEIEYHKEQIKEIKEEKKTNNGRAWGILTGLIVGIPSLVVSIIALSKTLIR